MSAPVETLKADTPLQDALRLFRKRRFRHVPVVDDDGLVMGILSDRDLLAESGSIAEDAANLAGGDSELRTAGDLATGRVLVAHPETLIREIVRVMFRERVGAMPIVNDTGRLKGIITRSDILRALMRHTALELYI